ncbi:MAG: hypothetical protein PHP44_12655 [Kiritimatiellae bacterium]|nr:hypothetical protein [Kiritimatiellia bacterium]MDD4736941.1 hypothetical protein [Kiritimatiellia bacterium]
MSRFLLPLLALLLTAPSALPAAPAVHPAPPAELLETNTLCEIALHLYRWYMDETDIEKNADSEQATFLVRSLHPALDPEDRSQLADILLPDFGIQVRLKKADYEIPELNTVIQTDHFKIIRVSRGEITPAEGDVTIQIPYSEMRELLFRMRNEATFPDPELGKRLASALEHHLHEDNLANRDRDSSGEQIIHLAPLSPIANELWAFWETGRLLIRFASDIDLTNHAVWDHENLMVDVYDIDEQVVVSHHETAGSNAYLTRDQVGRDLYNCIVLGKRIAVTPRKKPLPQKEEAPASSDEENDSVPQ